MVKMVYIVTDIDKRTTIELQTFAANGIHMTIKNGDAEMSADIKARDLLEAVTGCIDYSTKRTAAVDELKQKTEDKRNGN